MANGDFYFQYRAADLLMSEVPFFQYLVDADPSATSRFYASADAIQPAHCSLCASYIEAVERHAIPSVVTTFFHTVGMDLRKPQEVWGAPDSGFLNGWFVFVGELVKGSWRGDGANSFAEPAPGFKCFITDELSMIRPEALHDLPLLQFEFTWEHQILADLYRDVRERNPDPQWL